MNYRIAVILASLALTLVGCGAPPVYGNKTCDASDQTVYPTANGAVGVCMPTKDVVYLLCARELGLISMDTSREAGLIGEIKVTDEANAKVDLKLKESLAQKYAAEGQLAAARASAIHHCITRAGGAPPAQVAPPAASP